jgi:hypothetical protein
MRQFVRDDHLLLERVEPAQVAWQQQDRWAHPDQHRRDGKRGLKHGNAGSAVRGRSLETIMGRQVGEPFRAVNQAAQRALGQQQPANCKTGSQQVQHQPGLRTMHQPLG